MWFNTLLLEINTKKDDIDTFKAPFKGFLLGKTSLHHILKIEILSYEMSKGALVMNRDWTSMEEKTTV